MRTERWAAAAPPIAEEAPRPLPRLDPARGQVGELVLERVELRSHQVQEDTVAEAERRPVELVVRDQARVPPATAAVEGDLVDGRMRCAGELLDVAEGRQRHVRFPPLRARELVARLENVVHRAVVIGPPDEI